MEQLKRHASQLWQDSVFQPRPGQVGSRNDREKQFKEYYNYMLAKLKVANTPPAIIARVLSALVDTRLQTIRFLVHNFSQSVASHNNFLIHGERGLRKEIALFVHPAS